MSSETRGRRGPGKGDGAGDPEPPVADQGEPALSLRAAQKQFTRRRLVEAAAGSFRSRGYAATTIDDVVVAAGATRATFYLHFASKADLVGELVGEVEREADALNDRLEGAIATGTRAALHAWLDAAFSFWDTIRESAMAQEEAAAIEPSVRKARAEGFDRGAAAIVSGLDAANRFDLAGRRVRGVLAYSQLQNVFHRWMRVGWDIDRAEMLEVMTGMWVSALGRTPSD